MSECARAEEQQNGVKGALRYSTSFEKEAVSFPT